MLETINNLLKQLEASMRGKKFNDNFCSDTKELFSWAHSCFVENRLIDEKEKKVLIENAVKLHNRAKTITNPRYSESVTYLKSAAAWILSAYAEKNTKFCILFIRLHCRIASEWIQLKAVNYAKQSYEEALSTWKKLNAHALDRLLSRVEFDSLKQTVFYGYLDLSKLLRENTGEISPQDSLSIRACVGGALGVLPQTRSLQLVMARHVLELAHHFATIQHNDESIHYFQVIQTIVNAPSSHLSNRTEEFGNSERDSITDEAWTREVLLIRIKTCLGLSYLRKELNQCKKATSLIDEAQNLNKKLADVTRTATSSPLALADETFTFAMFSIRCRENDVAGARCALYTLLEQTKSFEVAVSSVRIFLEGCGIDNAENCDAGTPPLENEGVPRNITRKIYVDLFEKLERKFPCGPEHNSVRLIHLSFAFSHSKLQSKCNHSIADDVDSQHAKDLVMALIAEHSSKKNVLEDDQVLNLVYIIQERVHWLQSQMQYDAVIDTCDMLMGVLQMSSCAKAVGSSCASDDCTPADSYSSSLKCSELNVNLPSTTTEFNTSSTARESENQCTAPAEAFDLTASTNVVLQWKSHACLQQMNNLLQSQSRRRFNDASLLDSNTSEIVSKIELLADMCISIPLKIVLSSRSTRTLLLLFNAIMKAGIHCGIDATWPQLLPEKITTVVTSSPKGLMQAVDLILLLFSVNYNLDWDYVGSSSAEKSTSDPLLVKMMSSFDLPEDCTFPQQSKMTTDVEADEPKLITSCPKTILHQIMLCCQLVKEADDDEDNKDVAMIRLLQLWLNFYVNSDIHTSHSADESILSQKGELQCSHSEMCSQLSQGRAIEPAQSFSPGPIINPSICYLAVFCEMWELFLKVFLRCNPDEKNEKSGTQDNVSSTRGMKRSRKVEVEPSIASARDTCSQEMPSEDEITSPPNDDCGKKKQRTDPSSIFAYVPMSAVHEESITHHSQRESVEIMMEDDASDKMNDVNTSVENSSETYFFRCSVFTLQHHLLSFAKHIATLATSVDGQDKFIKLLKRKDVIWAADMLWNVGVLLMKKHVCSLMPLSVQEQHIRHSSSTSAIIQKTTAAQTPIPLTWDSASSLSYKEDLEDDMYRYQVAAESLELSQQMHHISTLLQEDNNEEAEEGSIEKIDSNSVGLFCECKALLSAIAVRLDIVGISKGVDRTPVHASTIDDSNVEENTSPEPAIQVNSANNNDDGETNISLLRDNFHNVETKINALLDIGMTEDNPFHKLYVMLSLTSRLILGRDSEGCPEVSSSSRFNLKDSNASIDQQKKDKYDEPCKLTEPLILPAERYLKDHSTCMLALSPLDLLKCADLALCHEAAGRSEEVARGVLRLAVQRLMRDTSPSYALLGNVYRRLIELSPDKTDTLLLLEEFEQLIFSVSPPKQPSSAASADVDVAKDEKDIDLKEIDSVHIEANMRGGCPILPSDVDCIVTKAFNLSILFIELDQTDFAERFVSKSMNLLCFTSPTFAPWKDMIRDLYCYILKKKADLEAGRRVLFLNGVKEQQSPHIVVSAQAQQQSHVVISPLGPEKTSLTHAIASIDSDAVPAIVTSKSATPSVPPNAHKTITTSCDSTVELSVACPLPPDVTLAVPPSSRSVD